VNSWRIVKTSSYSLARFCNAILIGTPEWLSASPYTPLSTACLH
jgi:hypothetical protein